MISRRKAKEWKTLDAWDKNMSIREYFDSKIDEIYDGVDRLKDKLKSKDKKIKRIQTNLSYERDWFEELKKQLNQIRFQKKQWWLIMLGDMYLKLTI